MVYPTSEPQAWLATLFQSTGEVGFLGLDRFIDPFRAFFADLASLDAVLLQLVVFSLLLGGVFGLVALGLTLILGVIDVVNFAHGSFMVVGMYGVWLASESLGVHPFLTVPLVVAGLFVLSVVVHKLTIEPILETPQHNQLIVTFGLLFVLDNSVSLVFSPDPRSLDLELGSLKAAGTFVPTGQLIGLTIAVVGMVVLWAFLYRTDLGRAIRGTSDDRDSARYVGINTDRIYQLTFGIGIALAGVAGSAIVMYRTFGPFIGETYLLNGIVIIMLGGLGSFAGALVGGLILGFITVFGSFYLPGTTSKVIIFLILILVLLLKPEGLFKGNAA